MKDIINSNLRHSRIAKIKNTILDLGTKFARLQVQEIGEKCKEEQDLIIQTVNEMIKNGEIYAEYFTSSKAVVFNLQANIGEIDKLLDAYKDWEKKEIGKKI